MWYRKLLVSRDVLYYDMIYSFYRTQQYVREKWASLLARLGLGEPITYLAPAEAHKQATRQERMRAAKNA